ncbi:MAG: S41 family peptidase [Flavobacteriaceae bacterium]|nr:S41 family peptidase [Flavobacteriaceae bacterium]
MSSRVYILCVFLLGLVVLQSCKGNQRSASKKVLPPSSAIAKKSISQHLQAQANLSMPEKISLYKKLQQEEADQFNFENEDELTMFGYKQLWENKTADALLVFRLIAEVFPNSANAYDSLGEVYLAMGDSAQSLTMYQKAFRMNSDNFHAEDQIARIQFPHKKELSPKEKLQKQYGKQAYLADLQLLHQKILEVHPAATKFISKEALQQLVAQKKALVHDVMPFGEFRWHVRQIVSAIGCSHSGFQGMYTEVEMLPPTLRFPMQVAWVGQQLYVVDAYQQEDLSAGTEILRINGRTVKALLQEVYKRIPSQAVRPTARRHFFNRWSSVLLGYALGFPKTYTIEMKGNDNPMVLAPKEVLQPFESRSMPLEEKPLRFQLDAATDTAYLYIGSFNYYPWNNLEEFTQFIDASFQRILEAQTSNLIIDVRGNGGGAPEASIYLLRYLAKQAFTYFGEGAYGETTTGFVPFENTFGGQIYFLIDGRGESTTGHFMAKAKQLQLGAIVGEELGSNQFCTAGQTLLRLPNTKLQYHLANSTSRLLGVQLPEETCIVPDVEVFASISEVLAQQDMVLHYVKNSIIKNKKL